MENIEIEKLEEKILTLTKENKRLRKLTILMTVFIVIIFIIQVYNLLAELFP